MGASRKRSCYLVISTASIFSLIPGISLDAVDSGRDKLPVMALAELRAQWRGQTCPRPRTVTVKCAGERAGDHGGAM